MALNTLLALKAMAEEYGFEFYVAQAYRYLGEYYLTCGEPHKATPLLSDALHTFHSIGLMAEADQVRNVAALSSGKYTGSIFIWVYLGSHRFGVDAVIYSAVAKN